MDLRRRVHVRHVDVGDLRWRSIGGHVRRDDRIHAVQTRGVRFAVLGARAAGGQRRRTRQHGLVGPGVGHQMDQRERGSFWRRSGDDHVVRRVGWRWIGMTEARSITYL